MGRGPDPLTVRPVEGTRPRLSSGGNRFDPQSYDYGVLYFGTTLQACFAETLARLRPNIKLLALVEDEWRRAGFMAGGAVPADWRQRRTAVQVRLPRGAVFVDVEPLATHQFLRAELAAGLAALGVEDLDVDVIEGLPVTKDMSELQEVAELFGLTVF